MIRFIDPQDLEETFPRLIRRRDLRQLVPLADSTIYDLEQKGLFPRRFQLTRRSVAWNLTEIEAWLRNRQDGASSDTAPRAPIPNVRLRKARPVRSR